MTQENWRAIAEVITECYLRGLELGILSEDSDEINLERAQEFRTAADDARVKAGSRKRGAVCARSEVSA